jgi:hypothetical protein
MKKYNYHRIGVVQLLILFFMVSSSAKAQTDTLRKKEYAKIPYWIDMMNDSTVNYFEAVKAFKIFWKDRKEPSEENEMKDHAEGKKEEHHTRLGRIMHAKEIKQEAETEKYAMDYKKFIHWKLMNEPYVQPNGHILSKSERLEIWKKQRQ